MQHFINEWKFRFSYGLRLAALYHQTNRQTDQPTFKMRSFFLRENLPFFQTISSTSSSSKKDRHQH